ncbi:MAG: hypothetical protein JWM68_3086 [Verrucomicrobiales bacterium]|nr:hypothetical protein [Verrucomicrobiales bacterium]
MPSAARLATAAKIAKPLSMPLTAVPAAATGARLTGGPGGAGGAAAVRAGGAATRAPDGGGADGAEGGRGALAAGGGTPMDGGGAAAKEGAGAVAAGKVGSLIVAEEAPAVGFGGRLMRTVSLRGCTLGASDGLGGTAPPGMLGFSAIYLLWRN